MTNELEAIKALLNEGLALSQQGSYHRRTPSRNAVPPISRARRELKAWIEKYGQCPAALRLLALAEESLLNYDSAAQILRNIISISARPERKDLKRLAACRQASRMWRNLALSPVELAALGAYLKQKLLDGAPESSLRWTESWLSKNKLAEKQSIIAAIQKMGCASDYQVLHNLVAG